jgi:hypothetical protein
MRKGQGAMEYLMTYGWALLVIIIVGAALFALGILNPATYQQRRCNGFQYFTYMDQKADDIATGDEFTLQLRNGVNDINISSIQVGATTYSDKFIGATPNISLSGEGTYDGITSVWLSQGNIVTITAQKTDVATSVFAAGSYDDLDVTVTYNVKDGIQGNTDSATCVGSAV